MYTVLSMHVNLQDVLCYIACINICYDCANSCVSMGVVQCRGCFWCASDHEVACTSLIHRVKNSNNGYLQVGELPQVAVNPQQPL